MKTSDIAKITGKNQAFLAPYPRNEKSDVDLHACLLKAWVYVLAAAGTNHDPVMPENPLDLMEVTPTFEDMF